MKTPLLWSRLLSLSTFYFLLPTSSFAQGSLTPPPGAPAPTMKTLDQIASTGIAINATNTPGDANSLFKITQSGSYYLTGNVTGVAGKHGILVVANGHTTIDLNGYELIGVASSLDGISQSSGFITIRNGSVRLWGGAGVNVPNFAICEDLQAIDNNGVGILVLNGGVIQRCYVATNGTFGIKTAGATVRDCAAIGNGEDGFSIDQRCTITGCVAYFNDQSGFAAGDNNTLTNCVAESNLGTASGITLGNRCSAIGCTSSSNASPANGIFGGTGCLLAHCVVTNNGGGIIVSTGANVQNCVVRSNTASGITTGAASTIIGCTAIGNTTIGIQTGSDSTINDCTVQGNTGDGIQVVDRCQITGSTSNGNGTGTTGSGIVAGLRTLVKNCNASENQKNGIVVLGASLVLENNVGHNGLGGAAAGIDCTGGSGSRIEANVARNNNGSTGILGGSLDVIIRNYSFSNGTNYNPATGANFGPIESPSTSTHPTANF